MSHRRENNCPSRTPCSIGFYQASFVSEGCVYTLGHVGMCLWLCHPCNAPSCIPLITIFYSDNTIDTVWMFLPIHTSADLSPQATVLVGEIGVPSLQCVSVHLHLCLPLFLCHVNTEIVLERLHEAIDSFQNVSWFILLALYYYLQ